MRDGSPTACVPALGGFTLPSVMAFHINSMGTSDSDHGTVNNGESQRTIDEGSSYRAIRLSSLTPSMASSTRALCAHKKTPTSQDYTRNHQTVRRSIVCIILEWRRRRPTSAASVTSIPVRAYKETDSANSELELPSSAVELVSETFYVV